LYPTTPVFIGDIYKQLNHDKPMQLSRKALPRLELVDAACMTEARANNMPRCTNSGPAGGGVACARRRRKAELACRQNSQCPSRQTPAAIAERRTQ